MFIRGSGAKQRACEAGTDGNGWWRWMIKYFEAACIGALCGVAALLLAYGGPDRRGGKLLLRLMRYHVLSVRSFTVPAFCGVLLGCYGMWLCGGFDADFAEKILLWTCLLAASIMDCKRKTIHLNLLALFAVIEVCFLAACYGVASLINGALGALIGTALLGVPFLLKRDSVGVGDILMATICGLFAGGVSIVYLLARSLTLMAIWSIIQLVRKKATSQSKLPLAPFLLAGALL